VCYISFKVFAFICWDVYKEMDYILGQGFVFIFLNSYKYIPTSGKVAGSIPDEVIGNLNLSNPWSRTMALWSTQPLTEMSTRNLSCG
jgi:hypothetical protein